MRPGSGDRLTTYVIAGKRPKCRMQSSIPSEVMDHQSVTKLTHPEPARASPWRPGVRPLPCLLASLLGPLGTLSLLCLCLSACWHGHTEHTPTLQKDTRWLAASHPTPSSWICVPDTLEHSPLTAQPRESSSAVPALPVFSQQAPRGPLVPVTRHAPGPTPQR